MDVRFCERRSNMKIAVSTTDGRTVCGHLGRCTEFLVYEAEGPQITGMERRRTACLCAHDDDGRGTGHKVAPFHDCQAVITQGMGQGMYVALANAGVIPVITVESDPETAVRQFLSGGLSGACQATCSCGGH